MGTNLPPDPVDDEDPTRALDGFAAALRAATPTSDPTRALDGWRAAPPAAPRDDGVVDAFATRPADERGRRADDDVTDVEIVTLHVQRPAAALDWQPGAIVERRRAVDGVVDAWKPGAWIGAVARVCGPLAEFVGSDQGPVLETFAPHLLLALWPPQSPAAPFLDRWPLQVWLASAEADDAAALMMPRLPPGAELWLAPPALHGGVDWALLGDLVLHHDERLREFQLRELRAFVQAQRDAAFARLNDAYTKADAGAPVQRR